MNIAAITVSYNDGYKTNEWVEHYNEYKDVLYKHIIVDNGSSSDFLDLLKQRFPASVIIERQENGGSTAAYNDGIKYALSYFEVDSIMLIGNDIKISNTAIRLLYEKLYVNNNIAITAPIMLKKDTIDIIESYGCNLKFNLSLKKNNIRQNITNKLPTEKYVDIVPGGMFIAKRNMFEKVGLQDEELFMYSDEVDFAIRLKKHNMKVLVTREAKCWHQHINERKTHRNGFATFLIARNKLLIGYKYFNITKVLCIFLTLNIPQFFIIFAYCIKNKNIKGLVYYSLGSLCGLFNLRKNYSIIINNKI